MDALPWLLGFVALVPLIFWFKKATELPPDPYRPLPPKQANLIKQLDAEAEWLSAYGTLPEEEQERRREEFKMCFLDHSTRLLNAGEEVFGKSNTPLLWASSRIKELVAAGKTFSDACIQAMDEIARAPAYVQAICTQAGILLQGCTADTAYRRHLFSNTARVPRTFRKRIACLRRTSSSWL